MAISYALGLNFDAPSKGDTDWDATMATKDTKLSLHDHTGGGLGNQIVEDALATDSVTGAKILLANNQSLRARNAADSADVNLFRLSTGNLIDFQTAVLLGGAGSTETVGAPGALSATKIYSSVTAAGAYTLVAGVKGQLKFVDNSSAGDATLTPASGTIVTIGPGGCAMLYASTSGGTWVLIGGRKSTSTESFAAAGTWGGLSTHVRATGAGGYTITMPTASLSQSVFFENASGGNVDFGGTVRGAVTYWHYSYLNGAWRAVEMT